MSGKSGKTSDRSAVTGVKMGRAAKRAISKNAECVEEFMDLVESINRSAGDPKTKRQALLAEQDTEALQAGRVIKSVGGGRLQVLLQDGAEYSAPIAGTLKMKGRSANKGDRANCMSVGDVIVVRGGFAAGKMTAGQSKRCEAVYESLELVVPAGFFATATSMADAVEEKDVGFVFDRGTEEEGEEGKDSEGEEGSSNSSSNSSSSRKKASKHVSVAPSGDIDIDDI
jgi:translation initiation factor IF-1